MASSSTRSSRKRAGAMGEPPDAEHVAKTAERHIRPAAQRTKRSALSG